MRLILIRTLSYVPTRLPVGLAEFNAWADSIIGLLGPGFDNVPKDDLYFVLATIVMHLPSGKDSVPKAYFVRSIRKGAANQVAGQIFQEVKKRQAEQEAKKQAEATAIPQEASDGQTKAPA